MLLQEKCFESEEAALEKLEQIAWPEHPICPHCEFVGPAYDLRKTRAGLRKCKKCGVQFTVRVGTAFERSHVPTHKWLQAILLLTADKKLSARRLSRILDVSYKSTWYLTQRIQVATGSANEPDENVSSSSNNNDNAPHPDRRVSNRQHEA